MTNLAPFKKNDLPKPPSLKKLLGPSFILLGLGLGSGELILWPYLSANYGMGIIWAAVLGITFQFFLNMEIERYTLVRGESIFVGLTRKFGKFAPVWFIFSTLVPWIWPGIIASSATILANILNIKYTPVIPIILLLVIGVALTIVPVIYKTQETFQKSLILIGVPFVFLLVLLLSKYTDIQQLAYGLIGKGENFWFLPAGISITTFLGAFAYAGAGGNLNLAQSFYIKEKGYGMGKYSGRITSILTGKKEKIDLEGTTFECNQQNIKYFKSWWKKINIEHAVVFWLTGACTMIILSLLSFTTVYKNPNLKEGMAFIIAEAEVIAGSTLPFVGTIFLLTSASMLFSTQFSVLDATSRIMGENLVLFSPKKFKIEKLPLFFYIFLWTQIVAGVIIFSLGFTQPLSLIITGAALNALAMFVYSGMVLYLNLTSLEKPLRPNLMRIFFLLSAFCFYGVFSFITVIETVT